MDVFLSLIALLFFAVALIGVISLGMLAIIWGPAAAAAFATFVTLHQASADGWSMFGLTLLAFVLVRILTGQIIRAGLSAVGRLAHAGLTRLPLCFVIQAGEAL